MIVHPAGDSCMVHWIVEGDLGYNPVNRYFGLLMNKMMGPDFERGLEPKEDCRRKKGLAED